MGWVNSAVLITCQRRCCAQNQHSVQTTQNVDSEEMPFMAVYVILINEMGLWHRLLFLKTQNIDSEGMPFLHVYVMLTNKMGRWYRLLFLRTSPNQQKGSSRRTETTNLTVTEHHPHQQICWSTKWVDRQDCCFWPPFTFLVSPTGTKWGSVPIWLFTTFEKWIFSFIFLDCVGSSNIEIHSKKMLWLFKLDYESLFVPNKALLL